MIIMNNKALIGVGALALTWLGFEMFASANTEDDISDTEYDSDDSVVSKKSVLLETRSQGEMALERMKERKAKREERRKKREKQYEELKKREQRLQEREKELDEKEQSHLNTSINSPSSIKSNSLNSPQVPDSLEFPDLPLEIPPVPSDSNIPQEFKETDDSLVKSNSNSKSQPKERVILI